MADLIDREDLMRKHTTSFMHNNGHNTVAELQVLLKLINEQPSVEAVPVVHGHWDCRNPQDHWEYRKYSCSNCGAGGYQTRYCSACGAMMYEDGGEQDDT